MAKDEQIYSQVLKEYEAGKINADLFTKALILSSGDKEAAKYQYVKLRVESIKNNNLKNMPFTAVVAARDTIKIIRDDRNEAKRQKKEKLEAERRAEKIRKEQRRLDNPPIGVWPTFIILMIISFTAWVVYEILRTA